MADKFKQYAQGAKDYLGPQYDSDEDLDEETQRKIRQAGASSSQADTIRQQAWDKAGAYPKLKRALKGAWSGDKRK